jgi:hypothetical protein
MKIIQKKYLGTMLLVWGGCLILFCFAYMMILLPQNRQKQNLKSELDKIEQRYLETQDGTNQDSRDRLNNMVENLRSQAGGFVVNFEDNANLTFEIGRLAEQQNVGSLSIKTKSDQSLPKCSHITESQISINFSSGFNQFLAMLNALERHRPVVFVEDFAVSRPQAGQQNNVITMNLAVLITKRPESPKSKS